MADNHDVTASRDSLGGQPTADTPPRPPLDKETERIIAQFLRRAADHAALSGTSEWDRGACDAYLDAVRVLQEATDGR